MVIDCLTEISIEFGGDASFPYLFGTKCGPAIGAWLARTGADRFLVVTDDVVADLHGRQLFDELSRSAPITVLSRPHGERAKALDVLADCLERAVAAGATRRTVVVTLGGGVVGNLGGLMAALLYRGVRLVHVPTTITAAMDSVLSFKQAVNSALGKNHFGTYHRPIAVLTDIGMLQSLPPREMRSGLAEVVKHWLAIRPGSIPALRRVLADGPLTDASLRWLLTECIAAKQLVMDDDAHERQRAIVLEYGHTIGHAIEVCDRDHGVLPGIGHGEAVGLGMLVAARIAFRRGWLPGDAVDTHGALLREIGVPTALPDHVDRDALLSAVRNDNKRGYLGLGETAVAMVLLRDLGAPAGPPDLPLVGVSLTEIADALDDLRVDGPVRLDVTPLTGAPGSTA